MKEYFVGLDIGTDSVGWAVTDTDYNPCRFKGNSMWGIRLFDESNTAEERRMARCSRRRTDRKRDRIEWLQMLFNEEISKKDRAFFQRLKESNLYLEDKSTAVPYAVFADEHYTDEDYHRNYKTIYHLRKELIESDREHDVRLVYLALHHIIKNRGHFLFDNLGDDFKNSNSFTHLVEDAFEYLEEECEACIKCIDYEEMANILKDRSKNKTSKSTEIFKLCNISKKTNPVETAVIKLICGQSVQLSDLFAEMSSEEDGKVKISFDGGYEDKEEEYKTILLEKFELIEKLKAIYDWAILADILKGEEYISFAKVKTYAEHNEDLKALKAYVKENCKEKYDYIFRDTKEKLDNYTAYCGKYKDHGKNGVILNRTNQEDFCKFLKKELKNLPVDGYEKMFEKIENGTFMPKQVTKDNSVVPMQVNRQELTAILKNASKYLDFLNERDSEGISVSEKILKIFDYRIPYYVGPLNTHSDKAWIVRGKEKIYPWNFENVVDIEKSAEEFIKNLTSKCTYLPDKDVIPKNSILYTKFTVLNELNNLRIDGEKMDVELKQEIFNNVFMNPKNGRKVTRKAVKNYLKAEKGVDAELTGIDGDFKSNMKSAIELMKYNLDDDEKEDIILSVTIFGDDKKLLRRRLRNKYSEKLTEDEIRSISKLKYSDWGALSREFLTEIYDVDKETGEIGRNIIDALWETNDNLMMLLGSKYNFSSSLQRAVLGSVKNGSVQEMVEDLYVSPKVKRPVYQSIKITNEIIKIMGCAPKKIFVETPRNDGIKGDAGRKHSRKMQLVELYKNCKKESEELYNELIETPDEKLRSDRLYLYYTQFGKCMYTGESIDLGSGLFDIDHIFPRSKVKDDSLDNRVLVKKTQNEDKDNVYPLSGDIQRKMQSHWRFLLDKGLISRKKYDRLTRQEPLSDDELSDFIARQIVETGQAAKAVSTLLGTLYPKPETEIVYVKAAIVSDFRHKFDLLKCREVNDFHHAKDAYLNIVVGNVYNERYTHNKINFIKGLQNKTYSLNKMFSFDVPKAWKAEKGESIAVVKKTMNKNNILYTRYSFNSSGALFKLNPLKKGSGQVPQKKNSPLSSIEKYGGYDKPSGKYFSFVKFNDEKGNEIRQFVAINLYQAKLYESNPKKFLEENMQIKDPEILIQCVKYNACIEIDGFRMHLSGKSNGGKEILCKPGMQLVLGYDKECYVRNVVKLLSKPEELSLSKFDNVSKEENVELYDLITRKLCDTVLKVKLAGTGEKLVAGRDKFINLSEREQCFVLNEVLKIAHCNAVIGDLQLIGEAANSGKGRISSKLTSIKGVSKIYLVNQSITGLFETKTDLMNM